MADHFKKIIDGIKKELTAEFKYDDEDDDPKSLLDLDFISGLVQQYHAELRKNLLAITNSLKSKKYTKPKIDANDSNKDKEKAKLKFYEGYQSDLIEELGKHYPELKKIIKTGNPTEASFSIAVESVAKCPKFENRLSENVKTGLELRGINKGVIEKAVNERFGYESVSIVSAHFNSVGFKNAYDAGDFKALKRAEVENRAVEEKRQRESMGEGGGAAFESALTKMVNNDPGNWVITSGAFSGRTLANVHNLIGGSDKHTRQIYKNFEADLANKKETIEKSEVLLQNTENRLITEAKRITGRTYTYAALSGMYASLPASLQKLIDKQEEKIKDIAELSFSYQHSVKNQQETKLRLASVGEKATNWILNTHATILANPNAFSRTFGRASPLNKTGLNNALVAMFKSYAKDSYLLFDALDAKGIYREEVAREDDPFYTLTQFYIGRDGVKRRKETTRYKMPRKHEGEGFTSADTDTSPKNLEGKDKPGMQGTGRVYTKDGTKVADEAVSKKRREHDYGLGGPNSMLRGLAEGMSVHDKVRYEKLQDVLKNLPKRTTKEWVINPMTGEQQMMRKGSKLGLMLVYDKHNKLVWKEFDVYGKARKAVGGSLERMRQKATDKQRILLSVAESMISDSSSKDKTVKEADAVNLGQVNTEGKVSVDDATDKKMEEDGRGAGDYSSQFTKKRQKYSEKIKEAISYKQLEKTEMKIYEDMGKAGHVVDPSIRKQIIMVGQIENFMEGSDANPNFYTGPMVNKNTVMAMREYGSPASLKAIEQFQEAQLAHYSEGGKGMRESNYRHESEDRYLTEYELLDSQLPIKTQIDLRKLELRNSGVKD